jgi:hypothetical protein
MTTEKTFAVIENGVVVNLALAPAGWAPPELTLIEVPEGVRANIGDSADPATWLVLTPPPAPSAVPQSITMRQARLALLGAGLLDAVNVGITGMSQAAQIEWEYAATVERTNPLIAALASALALTPGQVDALFVAGAAL